jgi:hypothetical protein
MTNRLRDSIPFARAPFPILAVGQAPSVWVLKTRIALPNATGSMDLLRVGRTHEFFRLGG